MYSSGGEENLAGCFGAERLSGTGVEFVFDPLDPGVSEGREVRAFWEVPAHEAVGVFVEAPLPGMIRRGEVDLRPERGCDAGVSGKLLAVVVSDGLDLVGDGKKSGVAGRLDRGRVFSGSNASFVYLDLRSTWLKIAPFWPRPMTVSPSQSPMRLFSSAMRTVNNSRGYLKPDFLRRRGLLPFGLIRWTGVGCIWQRLPRASLIFYDETRPRVSNSLCLADVLSIGARRNRETCCFGRLDITNSPQSFVQRSKLRDQETSSLSAIVRSDLP